MRLYRGNECKRTTCYNMAQADGFCRTCSRRRQFQTMRVPRELLERMTGG